MKTSMGMPLKIPYTVLSTLQDSSLEYLEQGMHYNCTGKIIGFKKMCTKIITITH